jgi:hypothetical protein
VFAELIRAGLQALVEAEATEAIGAGRYERSDERSVHRNGHRPKNVLGESHAAVCDFCQGLRPGDGARRRVINAIMAHLIIASLVCGRRS